MRYKRLIIWITIVLILVAVLAAFAYGKTNAEKDSGQSYYDLLNNYDWSKACPAAGCRNQNGEK